MQGGPETMKTVKPNQIMQITMDDDRKWCGHFLVVDKIESWGVTGRIPGFGKTGLAWVHVEPTGGMAVIGQDGKRLVEPASTLKHHP